MNFRKYLLFNNFFFKNIICTYSRYNSCPFTNLFQVVSNTRRFGLFFLISLLSQSVSTDGFTQVLKYTTHLRDFGNCLERFFSSGAQLRKVYMILSVRKISIDTVSDTEIFTCR